MKKKQTPWNPDRIYTSYEDGTNVTQKIQKVNYESLPFILLHLKLQCMMVAANNSYKSNFNQADKEQ